MKDLLLSDYEANNLISIIKNIVTDHNKILTENSTGTIDIESKDGYKFILDYKYSEINKVFNFREGKNNYTLIRININNNFHKNANGEKIYGNRVNIFSEEEFYEKNDGKTHYKCYKLPFGKIKNTDDFHKLLMYLCDHVNVINQEKIHLTIFQTIV